MYSIKINQADMDKVREMLAGVSGGADRVMKRAIDKTMGTVKTKVSTEARRVLNIYKTDLDKNINVIKYNTVIRSGQVDIVSSSLPMYAFKPEEDFMQGIRVRIKKTGKQEILYSAFIAKMKSGHTGVFWREWHSKPWGYTYGMRKRPWKRMADKYRIPIEEIFSTSITEAVGDTVPMLAIMTDAGDNLHNNIERELNYELSKL